MPLELSGGRKRAVPGPASCNFCRSRKLRCTREAPCPNCTSRGIPCEFPGSQSAINDRSSTSKKPDDVSLKILDRLQRLEEIVMRQQSMPAKLPPPEIPSLDPLNRSQPFNFGVPSIPLRIQNLTADALHLEQASRGHSILGSSVADPILLKIYPLQHISKAAAYAVDSGEGPVKCIWIPTQADTRMLLRKYVDDIAFCYPIIHNPSLPRAIDSLYEQIESGASVESGLVMLLLCIIASVTSHWTSRDAEEKSLFATPEVAHKQTTHWIKAALDVMDNSKRNSSLSLEHVQALVMTSHIISNLEGFSSVYRSLLAMAVDIARDLGLHSVDRRNKQSLKGSAGLNAVQAEMHRRIWWYLTSTDWIMSCHAGPHEGVYSINPRHMATDKPRNIDDEAIGCSPNEVTEHISKPTSMSYCLLRIRIAEICRAYIDRIPIGSNLSEEARYREVVEFSSRLNEFIRDLPLHFRRYGTDTTEVAASLTSSLSNGFTAQRYILILLVCTLICKLHFPYLARASVQTTFSYSRDACLDAARMILQAERGVKRIQVSFLENRLRFSTILYGIFMACTAFALDMCLNTPLGGDIAHAAEATEAFRMLEEVCVSSSLAAKIYHSLLHLLDKHNIKIPKSQQPSSTSIASDPISPFGNPMFSKAVPLKSGNYAMMNTNSGQGRSADEVWDSMAHATNIELFDFDSFAEECPSLFM